MLLGAIRRAAVIGLTVLGPALAQGSPFQLYRPESLCPGNEVDVCWTGGSPPYAMTVFPSEMTLQNLSVSNFLYLYSGIDGTSAKWVVNATAGTKVSIHVEDSTGTIASLSDLLVNNDDGSPASTASPQSTMPPSVTSSSGQVIPTNGTSSSSSPTGTHSCSETATASNKSSAGASNDSRYRLDGGTIAAIVIGIIAFWLLVAMIIWLILSRRKLRKERKRTELSVDIPSESDDSHGSFGSVSQTPDQLAIEAMVQRASRQSSYDILRPMLVSAPGRSSNPYYDWHAGLEHTDFSRSPIAPGPSILKKPGQAIPSPQSTRLSISTRNSNYLLSPSGPTHTRSTPTFIDSPRTYSGDRTYTDSTGTPMTGEEDETTPPSTEAEDGRSGSARTHRFKRLPPLPVTPPPPAQVNGPPPPPRVPPSPSYRPAHDVDVAGLQQLLPPMYNPKWRRSFGPTADRRV